MNSTSADGVDYLTASELYAINDRITGAAFVRDLHLLNSAVLRPTLVLFGQPQFPTLIDKAASYVHSLAYHHLFADGNKRTAAEAVAAFLMRNGRTITWDTATAQAFMLEVAQGGLTVEQVAAQLAQYVR